MDLDTAHRLNLIERNMEMAQTALDSARELMRIVIESMHVSPPAATQKVTIEHAQVVSKQITDVGKMITAAKKLKRGRPKKKTETPQRKYPTSRLAATIREYAASHSEEFTPDMVVEWAQKKGYAFTRKQIANMMYQVARRPNSEIANLGGGSYKAA